MGFFLFPPTPNPLSSSCYSNHFSFSFFYILFLPPTPNPLINAFKPTHCAGWVSFFFLLINQKQETHGTQSMGFEAIHQLKSRCVFDSVSLLLSFPCNSVLIRGKCFCLVFCLFFRPWLILILLVLPSLANHLHLHLQMNDSGFSCRFRKCIQYP